MYAVVCPEHLNSDNTFSEALRTQLMLYDAYLFLQQYATMLQGELRLIQNQHDKQLYTIYWQDEDETIITPIYIVRY